MKRCLLFLLLVVIPLNFAAAQETPPERSGDDLPTLDTANQIEMWGYGNPVDLAWSDDGETLAVVTSAALLLYSVNDLEHEPAFLPAQSGAYSAVVFHDDQLLAADNAGGLWSWDVTAGEATLFAAVYGGFRDMVVREDTIIAWTGDWLYVFDAQSGQRTHTLFIDHDNDSPRHAYIAVSQDGTKIAVSEYEHPVQVWDVSGAEAVLTELAQPSQGEWFEPLAFSADTALLFGVDGSALYAWNWENDETAIYEFDPNEPAPEFDSGFVLDDGSLLTFDASPFTGTNITRWNDALEAVQTTQLASVRFWHSLSLSPDKTRAAAVTSAFTDFTSNLMLIDLETLETLYASEAFPAFQAMTGSDQSVVYGSAPGELVIRDINTGKITTVLTYGDGFPSSIFMSEDGQRVTLCASAGSPMSFDPFISAFDLRESDQSFSIYGVFEGETYVSCRWMLDGLTDSGSPTGVFDLNQLEVVVRFPDDVYSAGDDAARSGETLWLTGHDLGLYKASLETGELVQMLEPSIVKEEGFIGYIASKSDLYETKLAFIGGLQGRSVFVYDIESEETRYSFDLDHTVTALTFSPDGSMIITGDDAGYIRTWDAETGDALGQVGHVSGSINSLVVSPDGTRLYSAGSDGVGRVWNMERE